MRLLLLAAALITGPTPNSGRELVHPGDQIRCLCRDGITIVAGRHVHGRYLGRVTSTGIERNGRLPDVQMWLEQQGMDTYLDWQA